VSWNHPDDVPITVSRRAYALRDVKLSQNQYAAVAADVYEDVRDDVFRETVERAREILPESYYNTDRETAAITAAADLLGLPRDYVRDIVDVFAREAGRLARERRTGREERVLTRENTYELAAWIGGRVAGGANELVAWGTRDNTIYASPGDTIVKHPEGPTFIKQGGRA
jgi:hypothetical protein